MVGSLIKTFLDFSSIFRKIEKETTYYTVYLPILIEEGKRQLGLHFYSTPKIIVNKNMYI